MQGVCKVGDAIWRAEAAYNCAYEALTRIEQMQRQMAEMHALMLAIKTEVAPDAVATTTPRRAI